MTKFRLAKAEKGRSPPKLVLVHKNFSALLEKERSCKKVVKNKS